jgi:hypothetical protein
MTGREIKGLIALQSAYNELNRNINRIIALRPELFTQQRIDKFDHWHEQILKHNLMFEASRNAIYNLFLLVLKLLDSTLTMYSRTFKNSYSGKYRKRVNKLLEEFASTDFATRLTEDLNRELNEKFGYFEMEVVNNINNTEVSRSDLLNLNSLPRAVQMPNGMEKVEGREVLKIANSYVGKPRPKGRVFRIESRRKMGNTHLNGSLNINQSRRRNGMGNIHSRRRNRNTLSNRSMNRRQTLRLNRMGNDPENTSLNSPQGISI